MSPPGPRHYYEIRAPNGDRLDCGVLPVEQIGDTAYIAGILSRFSEGTRFRSQLVSDAEASLVLAKMSVGDWNDRQGFVFPEAGQGAG